MRLKALITVIALAISSHALAIKPDVTPDLTLYISIPDLDTAYLYHDILSDRRNAFFGLFQRGTVDIYTHELGNEDYPYYPLSKAIYGKLRPGIADGVGGSRNVLLIQKFSRSDSIIDTFRMARAEPTSNYLNIGPYNCTATGKVYPEDTYTCTGFKNNAVTDIAASSLEPALFVGNNLPNGIHPLNEIELSNITSRTTYQRIMGIAATKNLSVSSLTRAQIASILSGSITDWSSIGLPAGPIIVHTQQAGTGAKAAANAYFLNTPCGDAIGAALTPAGGQGDPINFSIPTVVENSSPEWLLRGLTATAAKGQRAIGIVSREHTLGANTKWLQIDGIDGSTANAKTGAYDFFYVQSFQYRNTDVNGVPAPTTGKENLIREIFETINYPGQYHGEGRLLDPYLVYQYPDWSAYFGKGSRLGNTCSPLQIYEF